MLLMKIGSNKYEYTPALCMHAMRCPVSMYMWWTSRFWYL